MFWYNAVRTYNSEWRKYDYYHDLTEFPKESIKDLPYPFNNPDLIVVELFYNMVKSKLIKELIQGNIPYIIIPRGELTKQAQCRKKFKKSIANIIIAKKYARKAAAIQYLTEQEYIDSSDRWNVNKIIIPNGIEKPDTIKTYFSKNEIKCILIGRIEPYQKGLDLLLDACSLIKEELENANCTITICGPDRENKLDILKATVKEKHLERIIIFHDAVYGDKKRELLLNSDVFLIPSRFEGHPMALIEALSYGLPCIATVGSNMKSEIEEYNAGWTAENNIYSIKDSILKMIEEKETFEEKSNRSIKLSKLYQWNVLANKSRECFEKIKKET